MRLWVTTMFLYGVFSSIHVDVRKESWQWNAFLTANISSSTLVRHNKTTSNFFFFHDQHGGISVEPLPGTSIGVPRSILACRRNKKSITHLWCNQGQQLASTYIIVSHQEWTKESLCIGSHIRQCDCPQTKSSVQAICLHTWVGLRRISCLALCHIVIIGQRTKKKERLTEATM
jgi:hypothetical protein